MVTQRILPPGTVLSGTPLTTVDPPTPPPPPTLPTPALPETLEEKLKRLRLERQLKGLEEWQQREEPGLFRRAKGLEQAVVRGGKRTSQEMKRVPFAAPEPPASQIEQYWEEEAQDFEPFGEQRNVEEDAAGTGVLTDPFEGPGPTSISIFSSQEDFLSNFLGAEVLSPQQSPPTVVQEVRINVPGGLQITHILQNSKGETGYRINWQGTSLDWFPPVEGERE